MGGSLCHTFEVGRHTLGGRDDVAGMTRLIASLVLAHALGCAPTQETASTVAAAEATGPRLEVLSYNVNYGLAGDRDTLAAIEEADADVVLLQETNAAWEAALREAIGARYPFMRFSHCCLAGGLAILSRFPVSPRGESHPEGAWFPAARYDVETPLGAIAMLNVHLRPNVSDGGSYGWGLLTTPAVRRREIEAHLALVDGVDVPVLVAGDFNEGDDGGAVRRVVAAGLTSTSPLTGTASTWRWPTSVGELTMQFDHVLVDPRLEPLEARVLRRGRSDHLPVHVVLTTAAPRPPSTDG